MRRTAIRLAGTLAALIALGYFAHAVYRHWHALSEVRWGGAIVIGGFLSLTLCLAAYVVSATAWLSLCRATGAIHPAAHRLLGIFLVSQFGKYLPGNVAQHAGRLALSVQAGMNGTSVAITQVVEILLSIGLMFLATAISSSTLLDERLAISLRDVSRGTLWLLGGGLLVFCVALAYLLQRYPATKRLLPPLRQMAGSREGLSRVLMATLLITANLALSILALYAIVASMSEGPVISITALVSVYAVSWLIGFLTPGAPAGMGVREASMLTLMTGFGIHEATAIGASLVFRLVTTVTDATALALGSVLMNWRRPASAGVR